VQPLLVSSSAVQLATETVTSILKIDDIVRLFFVGHDLCLFNLCLFFRFIVLDKCFVMVLTKNWNDMNELTRNILSSFFFLFFQCSIYKPI
jgi:hypothetical protein